MIHELTDDDIDRCLQYYAIVSNNILQKLSYSQHICSSIEATFYNCHVHTQNVRYWSNQNPRFLYETHTHLPQKLMCGENTV